MARESTAGLLIGSAIVVLAALLVGHLALTDIWHGEADVSLEWNVLRICFGVIAVSQVVTLVAARRRARGCGQLVS